MCKHKLRLLSGPVVGSGGSIYIPPIFQCIKCFKVFKANRFESSLVEIPILELSEEGLKNYEEPKKFYILPKGEKK